ncbi:LytR family transcriptional regulator, partial [Mycobacterium tuberculosis]|nr:LytR family transcriptional regulator [Mycobacterium tuberculosis]
RPIHRRADPEVEPSEPEFPEPEFFEPQPQAFRPEPEPPLELQKTQVIDDLAYSFDAVSELRELMDVDYPNEDEPDEPPSGAVDTAAGEPKRRRPMLLAGRSVAALAAVLALVMT